MLGAIIGDIVGSRFEWDNHRSKDFELFKEDCFFTDDSVMSLAVAKALLESRGQRERLGELTVRYMVQYGRNYPDAGYGGRFSLWLREENPAPYNSWGNGSAMRVSGCGFAAESLPEALDLARATAEVTHNHPEGIKGAQAAAAVIYLARSGKTKEEIRAYVTEHFYPIDFTLDEIRDTYEFNESCQNTVPQALEAFFESTGFEDCIRNAISVGGDSDTLAAIAGGMAEAYYGIPDDIRREAESYLTGDLKAVLDEFETVYEGK